MAFIPHTKPRQPYFTIDLGEADKFSFDTAEDLDQWLMLQRSSWDWLISSNYSLSGGANQLRESYRTSLASINQAANELRQEPGNEERKNKLLSVIQNFYRNTSIGGVLQTHPFARLATKAYEKWSSPAVGASTLATLLGRDISDRHRDETIGIIEAVLLKDGISEQSPSIVANTVAETQRDFNQIAEKQKSDWRIFREEADDVLDRFRKAVQNSLTSVDFRWNELSERITTETKSAITSLSDTELAYKEQMALQAPVQYWRDEGVRHQSSELRWGITSGLFAICSLAAIVLLLGSVVWALAHTDGLKENPYPALAAASGTLFIVTILFWTGRVLVRLFLSARHLKMDAEERVAMIQTYLALTQSGKVTEADRPLVLAPIFRSSADGIVKDEGAPEASLSALLAKLLDKR